MSLSFSYETHNFLLSPSKPQSQPHLWLATGSHQKKIYIKKNRSQPPPKPTTTHPPRFQPQPKPTTPISTPSKPSSRHHQYPPNQTHETHQIMTIIAKPSPCLITTIANQKTLNLNGEQMGFRTEAA